VPAFSASAIVLESLWDQVRRQNVLGLIVQLEVLPKPMQTCSFLSVKVKWLIKLATVVKCNLTLGLLQFTFCQRHLTFIRSIFSSSILSI
jgi:hypothetical protein